MMFKNHRYQYSYLSKGDFRLFLENKSYQGVFRSLQGLVCVVSTGTVLDISLRRDSDHRWDGSISRSSVRSRSVTKFEIEMREELAPKSLSPAKKSSFHKVFKGSMICDNLYGVWRPLKLRSPSFKNLIDR